MNLFFFTTLNIIQELQTKISKLEARILELEKENVSLEYQISQNMNSAENNTGVELLEKYKNLNHNMNLLQVDFSNIHFSCNFTWLFFL